MHCFEPYCGLYHFLTTFYHMLNKKFVNQLQENLTFAFLKCYLHFLIRFSTISKSGHINLLSSLKFWQNWLIVFCILNSLGFDFSVREPNILVLFPLTV